MPTRTTRNRPLTRRGLAVVTAAAALAGGMALAPVSNATAATPVTSAAAPAAETWTRLWSSTISADYLRSHGKQWVSGAYRESDSSTIARGTFRCSGGGTAALTVIDVDHRKNQFTRTHACDGKKHYADTAYERGHHIKLILRWKSGRVSDTVIEAWANR